jgi:hypothetical protein
MARLDFEINIRSRHTHIPGLPYPTGLGYGIMNLRVWFGVAGSPEYRLNGGTWLPLPADGTGGGYYYEQWQVPELIIGWNTLEYRDDNGARQLGKFRIYDLGEGCRYARSTSIGTVQYPLDPSIYVHDANVVVSYFQPPGVNLQFSINQDGVTGFRGTNNSATFTAAEIAALGTDDIVPAVWVKNLGNGCTMQSGDDVWFKQITPPLDPLQATAAVSDVTVAGGSDGSITVTVTGGSGAYTVEWADDPTTSLFRNNLPAGTYTVTITDVNTDEVVTLNIEVEQPEIVIRVGTFFEIPMLNSLRFVVNPQENNNITRFQNTRNTLFKDMVFPGFRCTNYYQKYLLADLVPIQWWSDYPSHSVDMFDYNTGNIVKSFPYEMKQQNVGLIESFALTIRNHIGFPGQSRVYFDQGEIPIPLNIGDSFEILNNLDGFNGIYAIVDIQVDTTLNYQYLVINKNFTAPNPNSSATGEFANNNTEYNVYEAIINFATLPEGDYYVRIAALDDIGNNPQGISEPIEAREEHDKTVMIEYRNDDNSFDMTWQTGILCMMRIPAILFEESTGGTRSVAREADYSLRKVSARKTHVLTLNTYMLPPWLHVKLGVIFDLDYWYINKVQYQTDEDYEKPKYIDRYKLANSSIDIEEVQFFRKTNSRGISVLDGGFITQEQGFIRR